MTGNRRKVIQVDKACFMWREFPIFEIKSFQNMRGQSRWSKAWTGVHIGDTRYTNNISFYALVDVSGEFGD